MRDEYEGFPDDNAFHEMMHLFHEMTFVERMQKMFSGLGAPKETGEYKFAKLQLQRLSAPLIACLSIIFMLTLLYLFGGAKEPPTRATLTEIVDPEIPEEIEEIEEIEPPEIEQVDVEFTSDVPVESPTTSEDTPMSPKPVEFTAVAITKSPMMIRGIYGSRASGARGAAMARYGGSGAGEAAVMRALRWLKHNQADDGSWDKQYPGAMTAMALLTFLAHGETPDEGQHPEFGATVRKAIEYLVGKVPDGGIFRGDGHNYTHPIVCYALCEAFALTDNPNVKYAAERLMKHVVKGQNASGGWNYNMIPALRDDTSYMGWCAQAVKAGKMANLEVEGLDSAFKKAVDGFKKNSQSGSIGGFGYTSPGKSGLTGVGVLCMQLLGAGDDPEARAGLALLDTATFSWENYEKQPYGGRSPIYYWYYITQAKFHAGGSTWTKWNAQFNPELVKTQEIVKGVYVDHLGKEQEIGSWTSPSEGEHGPGEIQDTCLSALQLEVYYRYLPTFKEPEVVVEEYFVEDEPDILDIDI